MIHLLALPSRPCSATLESRLVGEENSVHVRLHVFPQSLHAHMSVPRCKKSFNHTSSRSRSRKCVHEVFAIFGSPGSLMIRSLVPPGIQRTILFSRSIAHVSNDFKQPRCTLYSQDFTKLSPLSPGHFSHKMTIYAFCIKVVLYVQKSFNISQFLKKIQNQLLIVFCKTSIWFVRIRYIKT